MNLRDNIIRAPIVPIAILATAGILLDRYCEVPWQWLSVVAVYGIILALFARRFNFVGVGLAVLGLAGLHHHLHRLSFASDDIGFLATDEPRLVRLQGRLTDGPSIDRPAKYDPLRSVQGLARTHFTLEVGAITDDKGDLPASGKVAVTAFGEWPNLQIGQSIEVVGRLARPQPPNNPGERDYQSHLLDHRIRAVMTIREGRETIHVTSSQQHGLASVLAQTRAWAKSQLTAELPAPLDGTASALLLGDVAAMDRPEWEQYIRTGVVHVIAVSGQHLAALAGVGWLMLRVLLAPRRLSAVIIALVICFYAALAGGRPPVVRSAVMVAVVCGAIAIGRRPQPANTFALAWLAVLIVNPADLADPGCQFSFLCVAVLIWVCQKWIYTRSSDPLTRLADAARPWHERWILVGVRWIVASYAVTFIMAAIVFPLTGAHYHLLSVAGLLIGPPAILLASIALIAGFAQLLFASAIPGVAALIAVMTRVSLAALNGLVDLADRMPFSHFFVGSIPIWWLVVFYLLVAALLWLPTLSRRPFATGLAILAWSCLGLAITLYRPSPEGLVTTFLAVGHGGCTVIETPDGRVLVYDCGAMSGPDVTRRIIAPYLWHRNISRIDEVFLSHADLDHFNGLPALLERFHVGRISVTPSFAAKPSPGVHEALEAVRRRGVPIRVIVAGDSLVAGEVRLDVLHPPAEGPVGPENYRSLVMAVRHNGRTILLTGDLDGEGRAHLFSQPQQIVDVLMAPHHGGKSANPPELPRWCQPNVVVACQGATDRTDAAQKVYEQAGCTFFGTWPHGAVTFTSLADQLRVETYRSRLHSDVRARTR